MVDAGLHYAILLPLASIPLLALALAGVASGRRWGRRLLEASLALIVVGWIVYLYAFLTLDFRLAEVARASSTGLSTWYRIAASWSSGGSSLYLYSTMLAAASLYAVRRSRSLGLTIGLGLVVLSSMLSALLNGAFDVYPEGVGGLGLNPLLKNPWVLPHPLTTFTGYALLAVAGLAVLAGERGWTLPLFMAGWILLSLGLVFGGYWSYETFGWGGYWAWDPVEISQLSVWLAATAALHSVGPLAPLRRLMAALTGAAVFTALYITRSGLSPLHSFAAANLGTVILLIAGLAILAAGIAVFARGGGLELYSRVARALNGRLSEAALAIGGMALAFMALFVYSSLLVPGVLTALGYSASVPTMAEGVRFYHPVLYPLMMLVVLTAPGVVMARELGEEGYNGFLAVAVMVSLVAALAVYRGVLEPSPLSGLATNIMIAVGMAASSLAAGVLLAGFLYGLREAARKGRIDPGLLRGLTLRVLHLGMALAFLGVLVSGAYAFSDGYMLEYTLRPGEEVSIGNGVTVGLAGYAYEPGNGSVDFYHHKDKLRATVYMAWNGIRMLSEDLAPTVRSVALAAADGNATIKLVRDLVASSPYRLGTVAVESVGAVYAGTGAGGPLLGQGNIMLVIEDANLTIDLEPVIVNGTGLAGGLVRVGLEAGEIQVYLNGSLIDAGNITVSFDNSVKLEAGDVTVEASTIAVEYSGNVSQAEILEGAVHGNGATVRGHSLIPRDVYLYLEAERGRAGLLARLLDSSLRPLLEDEALLASLAEGGIERLPLPDDALENVMLHLYLDIEGPDGSVERVDSVLRFESNGEAMGIHGLIIDVIILDDGLNDIYINVQPPFAEGYFDNYHELLVYYLNQASTSLAPEERLALAALMAAGYNIAAMAMPPEQQALTVEKAMVDLLLLSENFNPSQSMINESGITIRVKMVPGIELLWLGAALMTLSALTTLTAFHMRKARRS